MLLSLLLGCAETECAGLVGQAREACRADPCRAEEGTAHDVCAHDALAASTSAEEVKGIASAIRDPLVRDAAVIQWVAQHRRDLAPGQGEALCQLLSDREKTACQRRLSAAHLSR